MIFQSFENFRSEPCASDLPPNKPVTIILTFCLFLFGLRINFLGVSILILVNITSRVHLFKISLSGATSFFHVLAEKKVSPGG